MSLIGKLNPLNKKSFFWVAPLFLFFSLSFCTHAFAQNFTVNTTSFINGNSIPFKYSCDGENISPQLSWENPPAQTQSFALVVSDPDAPGGTFYHWVVVNIPNNILSLPEGVRSLPNGATAVKNSNGSSAYYGPCPPKGSTHHYIFSIYALDTKLTLSTNPKISDVLPLIKKHSLGQSSVSGIFAH